MKQPDTEDCVQLQTLHPQHTGAGHFLGDKAETTLPDTQTSQES